ncbi:hypothetical protein L249_6638 [Ophiocordyceps polyrhachis-furcata BCC 54312]|uniref:Adenine DNA glycosylase n=1 Tax=Ophiocordyceps polyrhachis-furcata BCC 54312 TaxID=1330021 RepID=A0A367LL08_9HYPO|nr:hypothetical protein L249_6638 [Ophiocordyceps polyrhachis-furcata BCC 54312]
MAAGVGSPSDDIGAERRGQRRSLRISRLRNAADATDDGPPKRRKITADKSHQRLLSGKEEAKTEFCMPPGRLHTVEYHRPLLLSGLQGAQCRQKLLAWFDSVSSARAMPWRKPWIDPSRQANADQLRRALERRAYEVWISEIMLQQTRVAVVINYWNRWMARWPTIQDLARAEAADVLAAWRGLGYYSRATRIHEAAKLVVDDGDMRGLLPAYASELQARIPGVGRYTAGAISAIVYGQPEPMVDGNVLRVLSRQLGIHASVKTDKSVVDAIWAVAAALVEAVARDGQPEELDAAPPVGDGPGRWGQALMELGSTVCTPKPDCASCPITRTCRVYGEGKALLMSKEANSTDMEDMCTLCAPMDHGIETGAATTISEYARRFPTKSAKKALREEETIVCAIRRPDGAYLVQQRPKKGLLAGLWELPSVAVGAGTKKDAAQRGRLARTQAAKLVTGVESRHMGEVGSVPWVFSHLKLTMHVHAFVADETREASGDDGGLRWSRSVDDEAMGTGMRRCFNSTMSGLDATDITTAYEAVRNDKDDTNWLLISYAAATGSRLALTATGTGGLSEMAAALDDAQVQYGYVRVEYANDAESTRVKFALVIWIGEQTKVMRKARVSIESGDVKRALAHHSIAVTAADRAELDEKDLVTRLRRAGGADYNGGRG